jgi:hypothetical protein
MHTQSHTICRNLTCLLAGIGLLLLAQCSPEHPADTGANAKADATVDQAFAALDKDAIVKKCTQKEASGKYKSHAEGYLRCCKPRVIMAFKNAGITDKKMLHSISDKFYEAQLNLDKGVKETRAELVGKVKDIVRNKTAGK